jgi:hypothetical protein
MRFSRVRARVRVPPPALIVDNQNVAYSRSIKSGQMGKSVGKVPPKSADIRGCLHALDESSLGVRGVVRKIDETKPEDSLMIKAASNAYAIPERATITK